MEYVDVSLWLFVSGILSVALQLLHEGLVESVIVRELVDYVVLTAGQLCIWQVTQRVGHHFMVESVDVIG